MRKNPCLNCWSSYPTRHESLMLIGLGLIVGLILTGYFAA